MVTKIQSRRLEQLKKEVPDHQLELKHFLDGGAILESIPDAVVIIGPDGTIARVNTETEVLFGYSKEELIGQPVETLLPERLRRQHDEHRARYCDNPRARPMGTGLDLFARRKDGSKLPVDISLGPFETENGLLVVRVVSSTSPIASGLRGSGERHRLSG